jgi:site-specific DNA recombinase
MRYLIYTRVSPKGSDWVGAETTVVDQAEQCRAYVLATDPAGEVVDVIQDEFESGGSSNRPGWKRIISEVKNDCAQWDVLVVRHLDRFSRSMADAVNALELFHDKGKHLIAFAQGLNSSTPSGRGVMNILLSIAQMEREFAKERTLLKMISIAQKGLWPVGSPPYGYKRGAKHDNLLYIDDTKAEIVREVYVRYAAGAGSLELARSLDLVKNSVLYMLKNKTYLGLICYAGKEYKGQHEPLISVDLFDRVQKQLPLKTNAPRLKAQKYPYLLTGMVFCECGRAMTSSSAYGRKQKRYNYYKCTDAKNCKKSISAPELETEVLESLKAIRISERDISEIVKQIQLVVKSRKKKKPESGAIRKAHTEAIAKKDRLTQMFITGLISAENSALMNKELAKATHEVNSLAGQIAAINAQNGTNPAALSEMISFARSLSTLWTVIEKSETPEDRRSIIGMWVKEIRRTGDKWDITLNMPGSPNCQDWLRKLDLDEPLQLYVNDVVTVWGLAV